VTATQDESVSSDRDGTVEPPLVNRFLRPRTLVSFVLGIAILGFAITQLHIDVSESLQVIGRANWIMYGGAVFVYYTLFIYRGTRWRVMLENTGIPRAGLPSILGLGEIIYLSWFANSIVPAKLGDVYRAYLLRARSGVPFSTGGGTIIAERLLDVIILLGLLAVTGLLTFRGVLPASVVPVIAIGTGLVGIAVVGLIVATRLHHHVRRIVPNRFVRIYDNLHAGTIGSFGSFPSLLALSLLSWASEVGRLYLVTQAIGVQLSPNPVTNVVMVAFIAFAAAFLTAAPVTPGGLGVVDAGMVGALTLVGTPRSVGLSVLLLDRSITFGSVIIGGLIAYVASHRHSK